MTTFDIAFDSNHDVFLDGSDIAFADEDTIIQQRLTIRLQFLLAEWFLDNTAGLPYTQTIFEAQTSIDDIYSIFRKEILDTEDVESIVSLDLTPNADGRSMRVDFSVNGGTVTGSVEVSV